MRHPLAIHSGKAAGPDAEADGRAQRGAQPEEGVGAVALRARVEVLKVGRWVLGCRLPAQSVGFNILLFYMRPQTKSFFLGGHRFFFAGLSPMCGVVFVCVCLRVVWWFVLKCVGFSFGFT